MVIIETDFIDFPAWKTKEFDEHRYNKLVAVMKQYGQLRNITVREIYMPNGGPEVSDTFIAYEVLEGRNILKACREICLPFVYASNLGEVDDLTAKEISLMLNELEFQTDFVDVAVLVKEITAETNVRNAANLSMFDNREIKKFIKIFDFDWDDFNRSKQSGTLSLFENHLKEPTNGERTLEEDSSEGDDKQLEQSNSELFT